MTDWREIRVAHIDWLALRPHIGRSAGVLRLMRSPLPRLEIRNEALQGRDTQASC